MAEMVSWTVPGLGGSTEAASGGVVRKADGMTPQPKPLLARYVAQAGERGASAVRVGRRRSPHPVDAKLAVKSVAVAVATAVVAAMPAADTGVVSAAAAAVAVRLPAATLDALTAGGGGAVRAGAAPVGDLVIEAVLRLRSTLPAAVLPAPRCRWRGGGAEGGAPPARRAA